MSPVLSCIFLEICLLSEGWMFQWRRSPTHWRWGQQSKRRVTEEEVRVKLVPEGSWGNKKVENFGDPDSEKYFLKNRKKICARKLRVISLSFFDYDEVKLKVENANAQNSPCNALFCVFPPGFTCIAASVIMNLFRFVIGFASIVSLSEASVKVSHPVA